MNLVLQKISCTKIKVRTSRFLHHLYSFYTLNSERKNCNFMWPKEKSRKKHWTFGHRSFFRWKAWINFIVTRGISGVGFYPSFFVESQKKTHVLVVSLYICACFPVTFCRRQVTLKTKSTPVFPVEPGLPSEKLPINSRDPDSDLDQKDAAGWCQRFFVKVPFL